MRPIISPVSRGRRHDAALKFGCSYKSKTSCRRCSLGQLIFSITISPTCRCCTGRALQGGLTASGGGVDHGQSLCLSSWGLRGRHPQQAGRVKPCGSCSQSESCAASGELPVSAPFLPSAAAHTHQQKTQYVQSVKVKRSAGGHHRVCRPSVTTRG